jgi:hypothetical protein
MSTALTARSDMANTGKEIRLVMDLTKAGGKQDTSSDLQRLPRNYHPI